MKTLRVTILIGGVAMLAACTEPPPPRSVHEFLDNPIVLEAALVRCSRDRSETRYEAECVNAREANKLIAAREEATRRAEFEAQSERKRQALRRAQQAAAEARRRAAEAQQRREEAEYLAQFGEVPSADGDRAQETDTGNVPMAVLPEPAAEAPDTGGIDYREPLNTAPSGTGNAPVAETVPDAQPATETARNLEEIRDELKRRNGE